jgi:hypothetical protein
MESKPEHSQVEGNLQSRELGEGALVSHSPRGSPRALKVRLFIFLFTTLFTLFSIYLVQQLCLLCENYAGISRGTQVLI